MPLVMAWSACVTLTDVLKMFLISGRVGYKFFACPCYPDRAHGGVNLMVGILCMMGDFNVCWVAPLVLVLVVLDEDLGARLVVARAFNLGWLMPP